MVEQFRVGGECKHGRRPDVCKDCNPVVPEWKLTVEEITEAIEKDDLNGNWEEVTAQAQAKKLVEKADEMGALNHSKYHNLDTCEEECIPECRACELRRQVGLE